MSASCPHIAALVHYTHKLTYFVLRSGFFHVLLFVFLSMCCTQSCVNQKYKYFILVGPKKDILIFHLIIFPSVYLELILLYIHDISSLLLLIPKFYLCTHGYIKVHEINHSFSVGKSLASWQLPLVYICNDIFYPRDNYHT